MAAIGAQSLDAFDHDGHLAEAIELIEHDHHGPGLIRPWVLFLHGGEKIGEEEADQGCEGFHHQRLDDEVD